MVVLSMQGCVRQNGESCANKQIFVCQVGSTNTGWHMGKWERDIYGLMGRAGNYHLMGMAFMD